MDFELVDYRLGCQIGSDKELSNFLDWDFEELEEFEDFGNPVEFEELEDFDNPVEFEELEDFGNLVKLEYIADFVYYVLKPLKNGNVDFR